MRLAAAIMPFISIGVGILPANAGELKGIVFENEVGGHPVAGVVISSPGANRTLTDGDGQFSLVFPQKKSGDTIHVTVKKAGYVVVNDLQLEQTLPTSSDEKLLKILICKPASREEMARRYYRLKSIEAIQANYQKLLKENESNASRMAQLQKERDQAIRAAEGMAEELAKTHSSQTSKLYNRAMSLFLDGRTKEALSVLDDEQLRRVLADGKRRKEEAEKTIEQTGWSWMLKARLLTLQLKFEEANRAYQEAAEAVPNSFDINFAYASFNQQLNRYKVAGQLYELCLEIAKRDHNEVRVADTLNNLGSVYSALHRPKDARQAYDEALRIDRLLAAKDPDTYLPNVACTLGNLGLLHEKDNRREEAGQAYDEALKIRRQLAAKNPGTHLYDVALTLLNMGALRDEQNRNEEARQAYEEALSIFRQLAALKPDSFLYDVAVTLGNIAVLHTKQFQTEEARQAYDEALKIFRRLAAMNPETYLPDVGQALNDLGILYAEQHQTEKADDAVEEALTIRRQLAARNPDTYLPDLATTLATLGMILRDQKRPKEAREAFEEALDIYKHFAAQDPEHFSPYVARVQKLLKELVESE